MVAGPDINEIRELREQLSAETYETPTLRCAAIERFLGGNTRVSAKLEFLQRTGTFKARGALATLRSLSEQQLVAGVTAVSAGNHAIATAFAAHTLGIKAKVVMIKTANSARIAACRSVISCTLLRGGPLRWVRVRLDLRSANKLTVLIR
jgi:threonine dehydratase